MVSTKRELMCKSKSQGMGSTESSHLWTNIIHVSSKFAGILIGKEGVTIKDLELKTETQISITRSQRSSKFTISGQEHGVDQAAGFINRRVKVGEREDYVFSQLQKGVTSLTTTTGFCELNKLKKVPDNSGNIYTLDYIVSKFRVGPIIGKRGRNIIDYNKCSGTNIKVLRIPSKIPPSQQIIFVCGTKKEILQWCEIVEEKTPKSFFNKKDPNSKKHTYGRY